MQANQNKQIQIMIGDEKESWVITGPVTEDNLLNLIDDGIMLVIEARELLFRSYVFVKHV